MSGDPSALSWQKYIVAANTFWKQKLRGSIGEALTIVAILKHKAPEFSTEKQRKWRKPLVLHGSGSLFRGTCLTKHRWWSVYDKKKYIVKKLKGNKKGCYIAQPTPCSLRSPLTPGRSKSGHMSLNNGQNIPNEKIDRSSAVTSLVCPVTSSLVCPACSVVTSSVAYFGSPRLFHHWTHLLVSRHFHHSSFCKFVMKSFLKFVYNAFIFLI